MSVVGNVAIRRMRAVVRRARAYASRRGVILLYHRVAELPRDPWSLAVAPARFDAQLAMLRRRFYVLPLDALISCLRGGTPVPRRAVAVTFDDGYADNVHRALPLLERHGVPATLFAVSGMIGRRREFWWDELERLVLDGGALPASITLPGMGPLHASLASAPLDRRWDDRGWRADRNEDPTPRHALYSELWRRLDGMDGAAREIALAALADLVQDDGAARASHLPCTIDELRAFAASGMGAVGAHTVSHPALAALPIDRQAREIGGSRSALESMLARPVTAFSYPFGHARSFTPDSSRLVQEAGLVAACVNYPGIVTSETNLFHLPRVYAHDIAAPALEAQLERQFGVR